MSVIQTYLLENLEEGFWGSVDKAVDKYRKERQGKYKTKRKIPFIGKKETVEVTPPSSRRGAALKAITTFGKQREKDKKWESRANFAKKAAPYAAGAAALAGGIHYYNKMKDPCRGLEGDALEKCRLIRASKYENSR